MIRDKVCTDHIGVLLLAAGESARMGSPKQLLTWQGTPLLRLMTLMARSATSGPVTVVLGCAAPVCQEVIADLPVHVRVNPRWQEGMGTSIAFGTATLMEIQPQLEGILIMLCDQVAVTSPYLQKMMDAFLETWPDLVLSRYGVDQGPPALFSKQLFPDLLQLTGPQGAKSVWKHAKSKIHVEFPEGLLDLDTPEQYARLKGKGS